MQAPGVGEGGRGIYQLTEKHLKLTPHQNWLPCPKFVVMHRPYFLNFSNQLYIDIHGQTRGFLKLFILAIFSDIGEDRAGRLCSGGYLNAEWI